MVENEKKENENNVGTVIGTALVAGVWGFAFGMMAGKSLVKNQDYKYNFIDAQEKALSLEEELTNTKDSLKKAMEVAKDCKTYEEDLARMKKCEASTREYYRKRNEELEQKVSELTKKLEKISEDPKKEEE